MALFAAAQESPVGTKRTWRDVRLESAMRTKADVRRLWFYGFTRKVKSLWIRGVHSTTPAISPRGGYEWPSRWSADQRD